MVVVVSLCFIECHHLYDNDDVDAAVAVVIGLLFFPFPFSILSCRGSTHCHLCLPAAPLLFFTLWTPLCHSIFDSLFHPLWSKTNRNVSFVCYLAASTLFFRCTVRASLVFWIIHLTIECGHFWHILLSHTHFEFSRHSLTRLFCSSCAPFPPTINNCPVESALGDNNTISTRR